MILQDHIHLDAWFAFKQIFLKYMLCVIQGNLVSEYSICYRFHQLMELWRHSSFCLVCLGFKCSECLIFSLPFVSWHSSNIYFCIPAHDFFLKHLMRNIPKIRGTNPTGWWQQSELVMYKILSEFNKAHPVLWLELQYLYQNTQKCLVMAHVPVKFVGY